MSKKLTMANPSNATTKNDMDNQSDWAVIKGKGKELSISLSDGSSNVNTDKVIAANDNGKGKDKDKDKDTDKDNDNDNDKDKDKGNANANANANDPSDKADSAPTESSEKPANKDTGDAHIIAFWSELNGTQMGAIRNVTSATRV